MHRLLPNKPSIIGEKTLLSWGNLTTEFIANENSRMDIDGTSSGTYKPGLNK